MPFRKAHRFASAANIHAFNLKRKGAISKKWLPRDANRLQKLASMTVEELDRKRAVYGTEILKIFRRHVFHMNTAPYQAALAARAHTAPMAGLDPTARPGGLTDANLASIHHKRLDEGPLSYGTTNFDDRLKPRKKFTFGISKRACKNGREWLGTTVHEHVHMICTVINRCSWCDCDPRHCKCKRPNHPTQPAVIALFGGLKSAVTHGPHFMGWVKIIHERFDELFGAAGFPDITGADLDLGLYRDGFTPSQVEDSDHDEDSDWEQPGTSKKRTGKSRKRRAAVSKQPSASKKSRKTL